MSIYLEDAQGKIVSNPINETNTKYPYIPKNDQDIRDANEHELDYQYMYNHDEPVSNIDTDVYSSYRNKTEELRTKTESYNEALQSCLVPSIIEGMSFQPWEYKEIKDSEGNTIKTKIKSIQYFFQDHPSNIGSEAKEFVFRTDKVKFIDDRHRRLIYDRVIHFMSLKEDEDNKVSFRDVLLRMFFTYYNNAYWCNVRNSINVRYTINNLINAILNNIYNNPEDKIVVIDDNDQEKLVESYSDFAYPLQSGQDINTTIPSSVYNLYNIGWIHASMIFLNGLAIEWTKAIISVDNIDTFVIVSGLKEELADYIDDEKEITMEYIHIPFKCIYMIGSEDASNNSNPYNEYLNVTSAFDTVPFVFDKRYGAMVKTTDSLRFCRVNSNYDRVVCVDKNIQYAEFYLSNENNELYLPDVGIQYNQDFRDFCNNDYRCKLKQFNFIGFEVDKEINEMYPSAIKYMTLKNDDFSITWHPFNIMDIRFKHLFNNRRLLKVFYNTKVLYDQDNILRIKNKDELSEEYMKYREDVTANIETYLNEIYIMAKKDIGSYINTDKKTFTYNYKYHYVTPYECYLIYNAIRVLLGKDEVSFNQFKNINVVNEPIHKKNSGGGGGGGGDGFDYTYPEYVYDDPDDDYVPDIQDDDDEEDHDHVISYINGGFVIYDDEHNFFSKMVKESTLFDDEGNLRQEIADFWQLLIDADSENASMMDFLIPIDDLRNIADRTPTETNTFYMYNGDDRGIIAPFAKFISAYALTKEYEDIDYDQLKLRFELSYINNMEEGATPVDELIYYFDNTNFVKTNGAPVTRSFNERYTANLLNALAYNIFKYDPHQVLLGIVKMNYSADYIIPETLEEGVSRDDIITTANSDVIYNTYQLDPRYFYNFGYYDKNLKPHKLASEWGLRRSLAEMFYWALDRDEYTINSMSLLEEEFDFTYGFDKSYEENLTGIGDTTRGMNYIIGYDADKLEATIKRGVTSITKTGKELKDYIDTNPTKIYTSTDNYKMFTFVANNNYIVTTNLERLYAKINRSTGIVTFSYKDGDGVYHDNVSSDIELRYKGQVNATIIINTSQHYIKDVDRNFTATYVANKTVFNRETGLLEFYDASDNLLVTVQADEVDDCTRLQMSRWNISKQDNYVMIFKNRILYDKYYTINYSDIAFDVDMTTSDVADDDVFEFVFFLNANNTVIEKTCNSASDTEVTIPSGYISKSPNPIRTDANNDEMDKGLYNLLTTDYTFDKPAISCNTDVIDAENVQLLVNTMPKDENDIFTVSDTANTAYELVYDLYSYRAITDRNDVAYRRFTCGIYKDNKVNGLYTVTKQGGGEYFLTYDGTIPPKTKGLSDNNNHINYNGTTNTGIGFLAFGKTNLFGVTFRGSADQWRAVGKASPWLKDNTRINASGGVHCSDGDVLIPDDDTFNG